jgi:hypothetical protein
MERSKPTSAIYRSGYVRAGGHWSHDWIASTCNCASELLDATLLLIARDMAERRWYGLDYQSCQRYLHQTKCLTEISQLWRQVQVRALAALTASVSEAEGKERSEQLRGTRRRRATTTRGKSTNGK